MTKYNSLYHPGKQVTAAQLITEIICEKKAFQNDKELPEQYWKIKKWENYFKSQVVVAHKLVKKYPPDQIIRALNRIDAKTIYSLRNPYLLSLIKLEERILPKILHKPERNSIIEKPKRYQKETRLSRLRKLQNG